MGAAEFNGTGANTSLSSATAQPQIAGGGLFTVVAAIRPDSAGQSNLGTILATATGALAARVFVTVASAAGGVAPRLSVTRSLTNTVYIANNRPFATAAGSPLAIVAAIFDDSASPKARLFSTCAAGPVNDGPITEHTYGTNNNGTGTVSGSDSTWVIGNAATVNATFDGLIAWVVVVPASLTQNQLEALAAGVNPVAVVGGIANAKVITFINGASVNLLDPAATWTDTALTVNDAAPLPSGDGFAPGGGQLGPPVDARSGSGTITATSAVTGTGTAARAGTSSLSAASALTGTGVAARRGSSTISATSALTGDGGKGSAVNAAITATATVTGSGTSTRAGSSAINASAALSGTGTTARSGTGAVTSISAVTGSGLAARSGSSSLTASLTFTVAGIAGRSGTTTITAASGTTGTGVAARSGNGTITGSSSLTGDGGHGSVGNAAITVTSTVTGTGVAARHGSGATTATTAVSGSGASARTGTVAIAAWSLFLGEGTSVRSGAGDITATSIVTGEGVAEITGTILDIKNPRVTLGDTDRGAVLTSGGRRGLTLTEDGGRRATRTP